MEFPVGTLGLGSEPRRAARLAGGTLNELEEGGPCQSREGRSWEPCAWEWAPVNHSLLREGGIWATRGASHMDRLLFIYSWESVIMGDSQSLP